MSRASPATIPTTILISSVIRVLHSQRSGILTRPKLVERCVGMIEPPVEPVIFENKNLLQLTSSERSGDRFAFEVPGAGGFGIDQFEPVVRRLILFLSKQLQPPSVNRSLERAHRAIVFT